ncbi:hypothetical protein HRG_014218 [Hirsutella rhossiliensis]
MATYQQERPSKSEEQKRDDLLWGNRFVPKSHGAGRLVEHLVWLANKLPGSQTLHLEQSERTLWKPLPPLLAAGNVVAVAVYFTFRDLVAMDLCRKELQDSLAVTADVWIKLSDDSSGEGARDCSMVLLFDPASPLVGPMQTREVIYAVQHYLARTSL